MRAVHHQFAGFAIGSRKLAAFAISAHASRCGRGSTFARRTAASTAGVSTTAVASFDSSAVTTVPTRYTHRNSRLAEPRAWCTAISATQSNTPSSRASSARIIIPARNR